MDRFRWVAVVLLLLAAVGLGGCGHERQITRRESPGGVIETPGTEQYGKLRTVWIREYRKPVGLSRFPDGGTTIDVAFYALIYQSGGQTERVVGRIDLVPVRRGDFGNLNWGILQWQGDGRIAYRVEYGYDRLEKVIEGLLEIPPLPSK